MAVRKQHCCCLGTRRVGPLQVGPNNICCCCRLFGPEACSGANFIHIGCLKHMKSTVFLDLHYFVLPLRRLTRLLDRFLTACTRRLLGSFEAAGSHMRLTLNFWHGEHAGIGADRYL